MAFPDPRFFRRTTGLTAEAASALSGARHIRGDATITTVAEARTGGPGALVFAEKDWDAISASAVAIVSEGRAGDVPDTVEAVLEASSPKLAFARIAARLFESLSETMADGPPPSVARSARIHPSAIIAPGAEIGEDVVIGPMAYIGHGVTVGAGSVIGPHVSLTHASIGVRCRILAGARLGEAGFGYTAGETGPVPVPQLGAVRLGDDVDIGAQTTVDRGTLRDTVIGSMTKIDNLCQIAHNCVLGRGVLVASQTGISGSCTIGDFVMMGGQVGMADHLTIGDGAVLAAKSGLMKDVEPGGRVGGAPAKPIRQWMKETAALSRLASGKK